MIRIALRRSVARFVLPVFLAVSLFSLLERRDWTQSWSWGLDMIGGSAPLLLPLIAGCACADLSAVARGSARELIDVEGVRGRAAVMRWGMATAIWAGASQVLVAVGVIVTLWVRSGPPPGLTRLAVLVPYACIIASMAILGAAVGWWAPSPLSPFLVTAGVFLLDVLAIFSGRSLLFEYGGATSPEIVVTVPDWANLLRQVGWCASTAVAVATLLLLGAFRRGGRPRLLSAVGVLAGAAALVLVATMGSARVRAADPTDWPCSGIPRVCVTPEHRAQAADLSKALAPLVAQLSTIDPGARSRTYYEANQVSLDRIGDGTVNVPLDGRLPTSVDLAHSVALSAARCRPGDDIDAYDAFDARVGVITRWLSGAAGTTREEAQNAYRALASCSQ